VKAWDYPALVQTFEKAATTAREHHIPALVHVTEVTQPQGHSTSGSHERYKSPERLKFEEEFDGIHKMREWMIANRVITELELVAVEKEDYEVVEGIRKLAWDAYLAPILEERGHVMDMLDEIAGSSSHASELNDIKERLAALPAPLRRDVHSAAHEALRTLRDEANPSKQVLVQWKNEQDNINVERYGSQ
jgi:2-oxoisovalerate dehydrogenase E1 component